jgi:hypothetical protein
MKATRLCRMPLERVFRVRRQLCDDVPGRGLHRPHRLPNYKGSRAERRGGRGRNKGRNWTNIIYKKIVFTYLTLW